MGTLEVYFIVMVIMWFGLVIKVFSSGPGPIGEKIFENFPLIIIAGVLSFWFLVIAVIAHYVVKFW